MPSGKRKRKPRARDVGGFPQRRRSPTVGHSSRSDRQRLLLRSRITATFTRTHPPYSIGDPVILFLSLGPGAASTGDRFFRPGRLLVDGRLVVFPATGQPQEAKAQQSKAQSTGEQPHDEYDSPQKWPRRRRQKVEDEEIRGEDHGQPGHVTGRGTLKWLVARMAGQPLTRSVQTAQ
jgi:hypothetical protein